MNERTEPAAAPRIAVLDYGIGNLRSAEKAFAHVGADAFLTADRSRVDEADAVVLPGVGAFGPCRRALAETGLDEVALDAVASGRPFLGICVGMQLLYDGSEEAPGVGGLGVLPGMVRRLPDGVRTPQMQWNRLHPRTESPLLEGLGESPWMYFVHSYAPEVTADAVATCNYGAEITALAARNNVMATQFHPEKSSAPGLVLLGNFVRLALDWSSGVEGEQVPDAAPGRTR
ncbi:MAG: imidazole glycerol phosphate synthase subunit HisH [Microthrixaceae bacterium]|nr:imidazole glycerol phosphate synthase subunit HisH [Microthrixaceae bacterium]MCB1011384.1 imidazole glycerol phosphate synthase subunit HisH [Microthrixaceae bacterium]MCO5321459.1 imidazole glycerol phosphate synthase subunit HisH [Microthrixaceae bacterium]